MKKEQDLSSGNEKLVIRDMGAAVTMVELIDDHESAHLLFWTSDIPQVIDTLRAFWDELELAKASK